MNRLDYTSQVATIRVYEKRLLDSVRVERMIEARDEDEVLRILNETSYSRSMADVKSGKDFETLLRNELKNVYKEASKLSSNDERLMKIFLLKYDYLNLKILLKAFFRNEDRSELLSDMGTLEKSFIKSEFDSGKADFKNEYLNKTYKEAMEDFEKTKDPQRTDLIGDKNYLENLKKIADEINVPMFKKYVSYQIDSYNFLSFIRMKKQNKDLRFLEDVLINDGTVSVHTYQDMFNDSYENILLGMKKTDIYPYLNKGFGEFLEKGSLGSTKKELDNGLIDIIKDARKVVFGPEPIFGYVAAKENENRILRIIFVGKINKIPNEEIRERLSGLYV